jgi:hypothetical protein
MLPLAQAFYFNGQALYIIPIYFHDYYILIGYQFYKAYYYFIQYPR